MKGWVIALLVVVGVGIIFVVAGNGRDRTGDTVRVTKWADDVCGVVGTWEGDLKAIRKELQKSSYGARRGDGGSGDSVEQTVTLRTAVDRAIIATTETLQRGLERSGMPDVAAGEEAAAVLEDWAEETEANLRAAEEVLDDEPSGDSLAAEAFEQLAAPVAALAKSTVQGRRAFAQVAALDPELADALHDEDNCEDLRENEA